MKILTWTICYEKVVLLWDSPEPQLDATGSQLVAEVPNETHVCALFATH